MTAATPVWFITGASRGIGAVLAETALAAGLRVVATSRSREAVAARFPGHGSERFLPLALDVDDPAQAEAAIAAAVAQFGRIDVLVNNAGYGLLGGFEEATPEEIEAQYRTNVFGLFHVTRAALPVLRRQRAGHVFNLSSVGGQVGFAGAAIYCSTKFAVEGFSESLASEVAADGIRVTIVEPGFFRTDFLDDRSVRYGTRFVDDAAYRERNAAARAYYASRSHQQEGDPAKLAQALLHLATLEQPPLRFAAGADAVGAIRNKLGMVTAELAQHEARSVDTAHPVGG